MFPHDKDLVFLILQFLEERGFKETAHKLEQESGFIFNMKYFEHMIAGGESDEVEKYLSCFTKVKDNSSSMKIYFRIRKQKYFEALDKRDRAKDLEMLVKDLKVFEAFNEDIFKEVALLLFLDNISLRVYPLVIAAHPSEPNQFALGLSDGGVHLLETSESEGKWGISPPLENRAGPSTASGAAGSDQPQQ